MSTTTAEIIKLIHDIPNAADPGDECIRVAALIQTASGEVYNLPAMTLIAEAIRITPNWMTDRPEWARPIKFLGEHLISREGISTDGETLIHKAVEMEAAFAARTSPLETPFRILSERNSPHAIGHLALESDVFVKMGLLGLRENFTGVLLADKTVSNNCLLSYFEQYLVVVRDKKTADELRPLADVLGYDTFYTRFTDGRNVHGYRAFNVVQSAWKREGRPALLTLREDHRSQGRAALRELGLPDDAWFVALHVREPGFYGESATSATGGYRNADISNYYATIDTIRELGGWIVRLGDPSMRKLPSLPHVIDYAHSSYKSDWMDVYISAACKLFIATNSGLASVPACFGVPCVYTNWAPLSLPPPTDTCLFIPKLFWNSDEKRFLSFAEMLTPEISFLQADLLSSRNIAVHENTSDEIRDVVTEALESLDRTGSLHPEAYTKEQTLINDLLNAPHLPGTGVRVGQSFLEKHRSLLEV